MATVSMFDAAYDRGYWLWAAFLFPPMFASLLFTFFKDTATRILTASSLMATSSVLYSYGYGVIFYSGDIGKQNAPFWQDVASIVHPVSFLILTPLSALFI